MKLKGNKGELSELYVFFEILAEAKIYSVDENLIKTGDFVEVVSITRKEEIGEIQFDLSGRDIKIISNKLKEILSTFSKKDSKALTTCSLTHTSTPA